MGLSLMLKEGDYVRVGSKMVSVEEIVDPANVLLKVEALSGDHAFTKVELEKSVEIIPSVFVTVGDRSTYSTTRLLFEAPIALRIERMLRCREFFVSPKVLGKAVANGAVRDDDEFYDLLASSVKINAIFAERRSRDVYFSITPTKRVVNAFRLDNPAVQVTVKCTDCDEPGDKSCPTCAGRGTKKIPIGEAVQQGIYFMRNTAELED